MLPRSALIAAILVGMVSGQLASPPGRDVAGCPDAPGPGTLEIAGPSSPAARGIGLAVLGRNHLATVSDAGDRRTFLHPGAAGLLRHAASRPGAGTAYVTDRPGPDVLTVMRPSGVTTIDGRGEVTHPAWSPNGDLAWSVDLSRLEIRSWATGTRRLVAPPRRASAVFSPVFTAPGELVAIVGQPVGDIHDDALNNLWRYDVGAGTWSRLTRFGAGVDRWSALRTPVVAPDGTLLFVRVHGRATATERPSFELWRLRRRHASKVRELPEEMYLAGFLGGRAVWNVPDRGSGDWRLIAEGAGGRVDLGCGSVTVDPVGQPDPDLLVPGEDDARAPRSGTQAAAAPGHGLAVAIGDFASETDAGALREGLRLAGAVVVHHRAAPGAVRPGAWAVLVPISDETLPEEALDRFRARHPDLFDRTWIVPFVRREVAA